MSIGLEQNKERNLADGGSIGSAASKKLEKVFPRGSNHNHKTTKNVRLVFVLVLVGFCIMADLSFRLGQKLRAFSVIWEGPHHPHVEKEGLYRKDKVRIQPAGLLAHYEAMVHPALLAYKRTVKSVLVIATDASIGKGLLTQLFKFKSIKYVKLLLVLDDLYSSEDILVGCTDTDTDTDSNTTEKDSISCQFRNKRVEIQIITIPSPTSSKNNSNTDNREIMTSYYTDLLIKQSRQLQLYDILYLETTTYDAATTNLQSNHLFHDILNSILQTTKHQNSTLSLLHKEGMVVMSLGNSPFHSKNNTHPFLYKQTATSIQSVHVYEESHARIGYYGRKKPQSYVILCKTKSCRTFWYAPDPILDLALQEDYYHPTNLQYFDTSAMNRYRNPNKAWEAIVCSNHPHNNQQPIECQTLRGFDPFIPNVYRNDFEVRTSSLGPHVGLGLFTKIPIQAPSYIMQDVTIHTVSFPPITAMYIEDVIDDFISHKNFVGELLKILGYAYGYGFQSDALGVPSGYFVESGIGFTANHGCNGTYNHLSSVATNNAYSSEREADPTYFPSEHERENYLFNPVSARHVESDWSYSDSVIRDLHAGEEMLTNYLQFVVQKRDWAETVRSLNALCKGEEVGLVVKAGETNTDAAEKLKKFI